jgi:hypothetical protein
MGRLSKAHHPPNPTHPAVQCVTRKHQEWILLLLNLLAEGSVAEATRTHNWKFWDFRSGMDKEKAVGWDQSWEGRLRCLGSSVTCRESERKDSPSPRTV